MVAIEEVFFSANAKSALKLGQVRGVAMLAAAMCERPVVEYAPLSIKSAVVGVRACGEGAGAVYGDASAFAGDGAGFGGRSGCAGDCDLPSAYGDGGGALRRLLALGLAIAAGGMAWGQEMPAVMVERGAPVAGAEVVFRFTAVVASLPSYMFKVREDGSGTFESSKVAGDGSTQRVVKPLMITAKTAGGIYSGAKAVKEGGFECASKATGIAHMGVKVLEFGGGGCTYDYSENKAVMGLTETFQAMAAMLEAGERLAFQHRYDRLGLNDEMMSLVAEVKAGRAIEVGNIAGILRSLVDDGDVLERVRVRAAELLKMQ